MVSAQSNTTAEDGLKSAFTSVTSAQRVLLETIADCDRDDIWIEYGAQHYAQWLAARLGISQWAPRRWITAANALSRLPRIASALQSEMLSLDKVVELCRFATPETEKALVSWARRVSAATIRHRADVACRSELDDVKDIERSRYLRYWFYDDGRILGLEGVLPADQGAVVGRALDRIAGRLPRNHR